MSRRAYTFTSHYVPIKSVVTPSISVCKYRFTSHYVPIKSYTTKRKQEVTN